MGRIMSKTESRKKIREARAKLMKVWIGGQFPHRGEDGMQKKLMQAINILDILGNHNSLK